MYKTLSDVLIIIIIGLLTAIIVTLSDETSLRALNPRITKAGGGGWLPPLVVFQRQFFLAVSTETLPYTCRLFIPTSYLQVRKSLNKFSSSSICIPKCEVPRGDG